ncbi:MAG: hypothetical protein NWE94_05630 [Candidatus Bathyarchaeota archaeon]|nr:hypothetical protein [Candidatus Bathyarchaeota archaeon]
MKPATEVAPSRGRRWFRRKKEKSKERKQKESTLEPAPLKMLTFIITLAGMALGLSLMPLFPQPLPIVLAFLVALVTFKKPRFGMPIGTLLIGLGLMYQLSTVNFIAMLGDSLTRGAVVVVLLFLFVALPAIFCRYKQAIAINMGILAAISLFSNQTYFLAIPLIFASVVLFKKSSGLTVAYYVLISVPLMMMQYLNYILQITEEEWWRVPGASPPIYVPLTAIFKELQQSMLQFRLYDTSKVVYAIIDQVTVTPEPARLTVSTVLRQYLDSVPGIFLFLAIVIGVVFAISFVTRFLIKGGLSEMERFFPAFLATSATALFFILLNVLQGPLAFRADITGAQIALGMVAAALFTLPTAFVEYSPKTKATVEMIIEKARELMTKLQGFEMLLNETKSSLPINVSPIEGKMLVIKDKLDDIIRRTTVNSYNSAELDKKFSELEPGLSKKIDDLFSELSVTLGEYHVYVNCEYSTWIGKFRDMGLEVDPTAQIGFQKDLPVEQRIEHIKKVFESGHLLAGEVINVSEQIYETIRSLYDTSLPEESQTVAFAKQRLMEGAPWSAMDALFTAWNNWRKQYGAKIALSLDALQSSLAPIAKLRAQRERLLPVISGDLSKLLDYSEKAEEIERCIEKPRGILSVIAIRDLLKSSLNIAREVLSILHSDIEAKETAIEGLLPTKDYLWERNVTLRKRMASALEIICKAEQDKLDEVLESMPKALADINECVETIVKYAEKKEFLLNYPIAEMAIDDLLRQKKRVTVQDLPFDSKYAEEYLRLFYCQRFSEFSFDDTDLTLVRRAKT